MSYQPVSGIVPQYSTDDNELASGYYLKFYIANTTTPLSMATDSTGGTLLVKAKLNPDGLPISNPLDNDTVFIPHVDQDYRLVIYRNEADADANNTAGAFLNVPSVEPMQGVTVNTGTGDEPIADSLDNRWISKYTTDQLSTATSLRAGNLVRTSGKATAGDGGGNEFIVEERDGSAEKTPDVIYITDTNLQCKNLNKSIVYGPNDFEYQGTLKQGPMIRRATNTVKDLDIYVNPAAPGGGDGSSGSPLNSINRALELVPRAIYHRVRILLADGIYIGDDNKWNLYNYWTSPSSGAGFSIIGHTPDNPLYTDSDPSAVILGEEETPGQGYNFVLSGVHGNPDETIITGVTFVGRMQIYDSFITSTGNIHRIGRNGFLFGGHGGSLKTIVNSLEDCDKVYNCNDHASYYSRGNTATNITTIAEVGRGGKFYSLNETLAVSGIRYLVQGDCICVENGKHQSIGTGFDSDQCFGVARSDDGAPIMYVSQSGAVMGNAGIGASAFNVIPSSNIGDNGFGIYGTSDGNLFLKVRVGGVEKLVKIYDYPTNVFAP